MTKQPGSTLARSRYAGVTLTVMLPSFTLGLIRGDVRPDWGTLLALLSWIFAGIAEWTKEPL